MHSSFMVLCITRGGPKLQSLVDQGDATLIVQEAEKLTPMALPRPHARMRTISGSIISLTPSTQA